MPLEEPRFPRPEGGYDQLDRLLGEKVGLSDDLCLIEDSLIFVEDTYYSTLVDSFSVCFPP